MTLASINNIRVWKGTLLLNLMRRAIQDRVLTRRELLSDTSALTLTKKKKKTYICTHTHSHTAKLIFNTDDWFMHLCFILLSGSEAYYWNTGVKAGTHPGWDDIPLQSIRHSHTNSHLGCVVGVSPTVPLHHKVSSKVYKEILFQQQELNDRQTCVKWRPTSKQKRTISAMCGTTIATSLSINSSNTSIASLAWSCQTKTQQEYKQVRWIGWKNKTVTWWVLRWVVSTYFKWISRVMKKNPLTWSAWMRCFRAINSFGINDRIRLWKARTTKERVCTWRN